MYLKEFVALLLSFPHFRVNILTVNSQSRDENLSLNALKLLRPLSYICSSIFRIKQTVLNSILSKYAYLIR